jgi:glutamyl-tRNA synthetase
VPTRTRYAPSPTGIPHVGNIRTALFSWLLARHDGGQFILRLEDTDRTRFVPESVDGIIESLRWLGLDYDEGPDIGGPHAPYVQSERLEMYRAAAERLLSQGDAYECWCSAQRLDALRAEQQRRKQPPGYDGRCRTAEGQRQARAEAEAEGRGAVVRFKTPDSGSVSLDDAIHGRLTFDLATIDDFVVLKSDGYPTYHLAYIVDDEDMRITHVLRGDEWIPSVPRHVLVYRALGIDPPIIAHTPRILGPDGAKLSKRHGATSVFEYRDAGYLPDALVNFLALIGWSLDDKTDIISREQLIEHFSLSRVVKSPGVFNAEKLLWMNGVYIREMPRERFAAIAGDWLDDRLPPSVARPIDRAVVAKIAPLVQERIKLLSELPDYCDFFFRDDLVYSREELLGKAFRERPADAIAALAEARTRIGALDDWGTESIEAALRGQAEAASLKPGDLFSLVRVAVTGKRVSPPLFETIEVLGRERTVARIEAAALVLQG